MGDVHMMLKSGTRTNYISTFDRPPPSYQFFKESIETYKNTIQQITQTTGNLVNRGGDKKGTTQKLPLGTLMLPAFASQTTLVGHTHPNETSAQHVSLV